MKRPVQYFNADYLTHCREFTPEQILDFLESFKTVVSEAAIEPSQKLAPEYIKSKLISIKIPEDLLGVFKQQAARLGIPYQTQIKRLMKDWLAQS
jgi:predicted DNA binding CopG/RHH family protein